VNRRGFTLIEVLVVLLILGLVGGVAIPRFATRAAGAEAVAEDLVAVLAAARSYAVDRGVTTAVALDAGSGRWVALAAPGAWGGGDTLRAGVLSLDGAAVGPRDTGPLVVAFDALGRARGPAIDVGGEDRRYTIRVDPWTGAIGLTAR